MSIQFKKQTFSLQFTHHYYNFYTSITHKIFNSFIIPTSKTKRNVVKEHFTYVNVEFTVSKRIKKSFREIFEYWMYLNGDDL